MPTLDQIGQALRKADAAGNTDDARRLAQAYKQMRDGRPQDAAAAPPEDHDSGLSLSDLITGRRPEPSIGQQLGRAVTGLGRNVAHGVMSVPGLINDPIAATLNYGEEKLGIDPKYRFGTASQATDAALNAIGVPEYQPQNATERVVGRVEQGLGGLVGGAGLGGLMALSGNTATQGIGNALKESIGKQAAAASTGAIAGGVAHESGASPGAELAWSLVGGALPVTLEAGAAGLARGASSLLGRPDAQTSRLASLAQQANIPLKASQISESKVVKLLDSATGQVPFSGASKFQASQQEAFNNAVGRTIGVNEKAITPEVFDRARQTIGNQFDTLAARNDMQITPEFVQKLNALRSDVAATGNQEALTAIDKQFQRILAQQQNSVLPGPAYKSLFSELGRMASGGANPDKAHYAAQMREMLGDAMDASISPKDAQAWALARRQYRDLKAIEPLVAEASATGGNISPAKLMGRVLANKAGKSAVARGKRGDLADLAAIGRRFIKEQVPDSGTARRTAVVDALKGTGAVVGSALGAGAATTSLGTGLFVGGGAVTLSRQFQKLMRNPRLVKALLRQPNLDPTLRKALEASINPTTQSLLEQGQ